MSSTYTCVELILSLACGEFRDDIGRATGAVDALRLKARRFAYVASSSTTSGELVGNGFGRSAFARDGSICVDDIVATNVTGAYDMLVMEPRKASY